MMYEQGNARTKVKICGLTSLEDARYASGAMADYLGFIFVPSSKRLINPDLAAAIIAWIEGPQSVGVFMNQPIDDVVDITTKTGIQLVQLHGHESPEYCSLMNVPVIKAIHVTENDTQESIHDKVQPYIGVVDFLLFDTQSGGASGGTGVPFDWSILNVLELDIPFFLAGGIGPDNVKSAIARVHPYCVDVNSKIEMSPGVKQLEKFEEFFDIMQGIWKNQDPE